MRKSQWNHTKSWLVVVLNFVLLSACATTAVVETNWDDQAVDDLNRACTHGCKATVYTPEPIDASMLSIRNGILGLTQEGGHLSDRVELSSVARIELRHSRHRLGAIEGLGVGFAAGALLGAAIGAISWEPCESCLIGPTTRGSAAVLSGLAVGSVGGLLGLVLGGLGGKEEVTVYEYRPDVQ